MKSVNGALAKITAMRKLKYILVLPWLSKQHWDRWSELHMVIYFSSCYFIVSMLYLLTILWLLMCLNQKKISCFVLLVVCVALHHKRHNAHLLHVLLPQRRSWPSGF